MLYPTMQIKILKLSKFEKWILYIFIRGIVMYVYFVFTVPLRAYSGVLIFLMLSRVVVIIPRCCRQHRKFFSIVAHSAEK
jgi:hypothetical protein